MFLLRASMFALSLAALPIPASAGTPAAAIAARNKAVIRAAFDRWAQGGTTFFADVLTPDMVWTIAGSGRDAGTYRGREAFQQQVIAPFTRLLATPIRPEVENVWADGAHVIVRWRGTAVTRTGQRYANDYVWIFHMRGDRADQVTAFLDLAAYGRVFADAEAARDRPR